MNIPTRDDRLRSIYKDELETYIPLINEAILNDPNKREDNRGYPYLSVVLEEQTYLPSELVDLLNNIYMEPGWIIEQHEIKEYHHELRVYFRR